MGTKQETEKTARILAYLDNAISRYIERMSEIMPSDSAFFQAFRSIPTHQLGTDGRTLRGLCLRGFITMSPQNNHSHDPKYFSHWYEVHLTSAGVTLAKTALAKAEGK